MPRPRRVWQGGLAALLLLALGACMPYTVPTRSGAQAQPHLIERPLGAMYYATADGYDLVVHHWDPPGKPKAVILALHGFNDYSRFIQDAAKAWAADGIATYAYDQRGFGAGPNRGLWAGTDAYTGDAAAMLRLLAQRYPGVPLYLLGESMGGAVAMVTLARNPDLPVEGVILSAPAVWSRSNMPGYQQFGLFLASYTVPWMPVSGRGLKIQASDNIEALIALGRDPLVIKETRVDAVHGLVDLMDEAQASAPRLETPALLLYGRKDELIPADPMLQLWASLPPDEQGRQRPAFYSNGWHLLFKDLDAQLVIRDVAAWIADSTAPLPSGADQQAAILLEQAEEGGRVELPESPK